MAWELVLPSVVGRSENRMERVTIALRKTSGRSKTQTVVTLGGAVAQALGWTRKMRVMVQRDPRAGLLRVSRHPSGVPDTFALNGKTESPMVFVVFYLPGTPDTKAYPATPVPHRIDGDAVILELPAWACVTTPAAPARGAPAVSRSAGFPDVPGPAMEAALALTLPRGLDLRRNDLQEAIKMALGGASAAAIAAAFSVPVALVNVWAGQVRTVARTATKSADARARAAA